MNRVAQEIGEAADLMFHDIVILAAKAYKLE